ncbi:MAG: 4-diphosphocytidyl-2C-methyl-D-erythritol synthase [Nevskia sp.]|nr:4-diphosphocytidyl-2C-methyl-D-erythritol synthase [Nevskia sp.]
MDFGELPLDAAQGAILAHSVKLADGQLKKGTQLERSDIERLRRAGHHSVMAARLAADDIDEDRAAARIAAALAPAGSCSVRIGIAVRGRCNVFATTHGLLQLDTARIHALNAVDEAVTVATLNTETVVVPGQMLATVKIIPFAVPAMVLARCEAALAAKPQLPPALGVAPFSAHRIGLVQTRLPGFNEALIGKTTRVIGARLALLGQQLSAQASCAHTIAALADSLRTQVANGCELLLVQGAAAIADRGDVIPAAIVAGGGEVLRFGMPAEPGNLLLLGRIGSCSVIGLPSCARSPKRNGLDLLLQRYAAGLPIDSDYIAQLGVGGLLADSTESQVDGGDERRVAAPRRIAAIVLAAGRSSRMAPHNKLLQPAGDRSLLRHAAEAALAAGCAPVVIVTGPEPAAIAAALDGLELRCIANAEHDEGIASSIRAGVAALPADVEAALFLLGDMPLIRAAHLLRLAAAFEPDAARNVCVPVWQGKRGNPVLWGAAHFPQLAQLRGDRGARVLFGALAAQLVEVAMPDDAVLVDIDTVAALDDVRARLECGATQAPLDSRLDEVH